MQPPVARGLIPHLRTEHSQNFHTPACRVCYLGCMHNPMHSDDNNSNLADPYAMFNPHDYIQATGDGFALCNNPFADGGLSAITVNTQLVGESLRNFEASVKRMVLSKLFSPKFGEIILTATRLNH